MLPDDARGKIALRTRLVALQHHILRQIQHDCRRMDILFACEIKHLLPCRALNICCVNDGQLHVVQALVRRIKEQIKRIAGNGLAVFVITDHCTEKIRGQHLRILEKAVCKGCFS